MFVLRLILLFCVALWFILRGVPCFKVFPCCLSPCFVIPFSIVITSLGEEGASLCASRAFVCFVCVTCSFVIHFSFPLGVAGWLRFVIVALPGLFCKLFFIERGKLLITRLWTQGYQRTKLVSTRKTFSGRHYDFIYPFNVAVSRIILIFLPLTSQRQT